MADPLQIALTTSSASKANDHLASQITKALRDADLVTASDEKDVLNILTTGDSKAGDWLAIIQKNIHRSY